MMRVGFVGWRGMVGSVLMQRMLEEQDFARIEPHFFTTSRVGGQGPSVGRDIAPLADAMSVDALKGMDTLISCQGGDYTRQMHPKLRAAGWNGYWIDAASTLRMQDDAVIVLDPVNRYVIDKALSKGVRNYIGGNCTNSILLMGVGALMLCAATCCWPGGAMKERESAGEHAGSAGSGGRAQRFRRLQRLPSFARRRTRAVVAAPRGSASATASESSPAYTARAAASSSRCARWNAREGTSAPTRRASSSVKCRPFTSAPTPSTPLLRKYARASSSYAAAAEPPSTRSAAGRATVQRGQPRRLRRSTPVAGSRCA